MDSQGLQMRFKSEQALGGPLFKQKETFIRQMLGFL